MRYFLEIKYKGTNYHGWQIQNNAVTVQGVLNEALQVSLQNEVSTYGSGRTDAGVHAVQQFVEMDVETSLNEQKLLVSLNKLLPEDISVKAIHRVQDNASARYDAESRTYNYQIIHYKDPFLHDLAYRYTKKPDVALMNEAAKMMMQYQDFECFSKVKTDVDHFLCDIKDAYWEYRGEALVFEITANRFLRGMVRAVVGTLLDVGFYKTSFEAFKAIIESKDRKKAGMSAPASGLYLVSVKYPDRLFL